MQPKFTQRKQGFFFAKFIVLTMILVASSQLMMAQDLPAEKKAALDRFEAMAKSDNDARLPNRPVRPVTENPQAVCQTFTGNFAGAPTMSNRLFRPGATTNCTVPYAFPGTIAQTVPYVTFTYTNTTGLSQCGTFTLSTTGAGSNAQFGIYNGSFNPASLSTNYLADPGVSGVGAPVSCQATIASGQTIVFAVFDLGTPAATLTLTVDFPVCSSAPCAGTPNPGNTLANVTFACPTVPVSLSLQNGTPGSGVTYQWQKASVAAGPYTNIVGATNATYSAIQTAATYYRCNVTCATTSTTGTSTPVFVDQNLFYNCYCANNAGDAADEDLFNITIGSLNNSSDCSTLAPGAGSVRNRYSNYKTLAPASVVTGSLPISIQIGTCGGNWPNGAVAWIDFNQNGAFDHPAERIYAEPSVQTGPHTATGVATIPTTTSFGITGMRVIAVENIGGPTPLAMGPCTSYTWGETEDYLVNVQPCVPLPVSGVTAPATVTGECSGIVAIPVNTGTASFPSFQWEYRVNASSPWQIAVDGGLGGVVTGATTGTLVLINVPSTLSGYQFRAIVTNPCSAPDFTAPPTTVTINPLVARVSPTSATICRGQLQQLQLASPQASFSSGPLNLNVPDGVPAGITTNLPVSGIPTSATITEIRVTFNMTHTWVGDMSVNLRAPNGQTINLFALLNNGTGGNGTANFVNTSISSDNTFPSLSSAAAPRTGVYRADRYGTVLNAAPYGPTSLPVTTQVWTGLLNAATINGTWTLGLADLGPADLGVLQNWSITISYGAPITGIWSQSPAPAPPNQFAGMWTNSAGTVAYTGGAASTIWVNPTANTVYSVVASTVTPPCTSAPTQIPINVTQPLTALSTVANKSVCTGSSTSFTVTATSPAGSPYDGPFTYQWQESRDNGLTWSNVANGGVYSGATTNTLTLTGVTRSAPADFNLYRYRVNVNAAACGTALTSNAALLTVFALPNVTLTASDLALTPGSTSVLTATSSPAAQTATSWSWTRNGSAIAGANTNSVTADVDKLGVYRATVTDVNGCTNSSNSVLIESEVSDRLWIYPNPTTGKFQVRWYYSGAYTEIRRVRIYNAAGQQIASRDWPLSNITPHYLQMNLDLTGLSGGIYVIQVSDLYDKKHVQGLLIKQ